MPVSIRASACAEAATAQGASPANADQLLEPAALQFSSAFEHAPIGMSLLGPDLRRLRVNAAFCRMVGYSEAQLLSHSPPQVTHPYDLAACVRECEALLAGVRDVFTREMRCLHKDGHALWCSLTCSLVRDRHGQPVHFISHVQDITGKRAVEQALRESEERFRSLTLLSSDWYWEQDSSLRFTLVSMNGDIKPFAPSAALGRTRWEMDAVEPLGTTWAAHRAALEAHRPFRDLRYTYRDSGGQMRVISASGEPIFDAQGQFRGYRGTARDVTQQRRAEERLQDMQSLLQMAAQVGRLGAWAWDVGAERLMWSDEVCAIHGLPRGFAPTPQEALDLIAPDYRLAMRTVLRACIEQGSQFDVEAQILTGLGTRVWVRVICEPEWDAQGKVRRIQGACQDISESRQASERMRALASQLSTTLESLTDAFFTLDRDWRFSYVNAEAERLLRTTRIELLGRVAWEVLPQFGDGRFERELRRAMHENLTVQFDEHHASTDTWVQVKAFPSHQGLAVDVKDVTERVNAQREILRLNAQLEERVQQRTAQLEAANKELEAFSYSIAHDLRAPLSSIDGFSQMLHKAAADALPARASHYLARIRAGVRQMGDLTDGLLALAHLSRTTLRLEPVDLAELARNALGACTEGAPQRKLRASVSPALFVRGDPRLLAQVMGNLVGNAWKFTAQREEAHIDVGVEHDAHGAPVYFVRDNGAGFEMANADRIFEAFQRMHTAAEFEGTGVGLAIVHKIVTRHGGRVWPESAPGVGTTMRFTLGAH